MGVLISIWLIIMLSFILVGGSTAVDCGSKTDPSGVAYTITVDPSGKGNFTRVQAAIDSVPPHGTQWIRIFIKPGTYREQVTIEATKTCIVLEGENRKTTAIDFNSPQTKDSGATFMVHADNFVARRISFLNTYHVDSGKRTMAAAVGIKGDKVSFYDCGFYGLQDTLWDAVGRHYFQGCQIQGAVDFIWGSGLSIYENCHIMVNGEELGNLTGFITAQGSSAPKPQTGFVFIGGVVNGTGSVYLGRPYRPYATVIFYRTIFSEVVHPKGWDFWLQGKHLDTLMFAEAECQGPGAKNTSRVEWRKTLSLQEIQRYTNISFIDSEGWVRKQPSPQN